jgi:chromatin segregation and condensation protein Rec8/ScpA/Scc1 (kleisin family)
LRGKYAEQVDRDSAYEKLAARLREAPAEEAPIPAPRPDGKAPSRTPRTRSPRPEKPQQSTTEKVLESTAFKQMARSAAAVIGREITRSIFGTRRR